jgi:uroporphyrin-III C-methyltransferase
MSGKVYIVGAGPGSADLLTMRAVALLRAADTVLHDDLVTPEILALVASPAKKISVGKRYGDHHHTQEQINALMVWHANKGSTVVRLKSGDPSIFGRLGEELEALRRARIEFEIVPGVTAASAAASAAEITLTDRRAASALVIVTAHNCRGESLRTAGLDPQKSTFAVYMPGPDYGRTARDLINSGVEANTPCVLVSQAGRSAEPGRNSEQICFMTLSDLPFVVGVQAPALLVVGEVARTAQHGKLADSYTFAGPIAHPPAMDGTRVTSSPSANL